MISGKKKIALLTTLSLMLLLVGMIIGIAVARPYFLSTNMLDLTISKVLQVNSYAKDFGDIDPELAKRQILLDLELNLSKLKLLSNKATTAQKEKICQQLGVIAENKQSLINLANQMEDADVHVSRLNRFLNELTECDQ